MTQAARASLEELRLDYEDFLRQRKLVLWEKDNPLRQELVNGRCKTADEVALWIVNVKARYGRDIASIPSILPKNIYPEISANAALVLIWVTCALLDRQVSRLAQDFEKRRRLYGKTL